MSSTNAVIYTFGVYLFSDIIIMFSKHTACILPRFLEILPNFLVVYICPFII